MQRIIIHVDMDYFFAAVEERLHPEFKGKPVVVGADPKEGKGRGVVSTCNYEARKFGIKSGMPISKAWKLCPTAIFLPVNIELYSEVSDRIMSLLRRYADKFESWGLDEAFLDVSQRVRSFKEAESLAREIKKEILEKEGLTCSIGIGPNKLVAKIASDFRKPNGLTVIEPEEVKQFLSPLPVGKLLWIGKKTEQALNEIGIFTVGDLAGFDEEKLIEIFGVRGRLFHQMAHGVDESEVEERAEAKSIGRRLTFEEDTRDKNLIFTTLDELAKEVYDELKSLKLQYKTVTAEIRYEDFETHTHSRTLNLATGSLDTMVNTAKELIEPFLKSPKKVRLVGVRVSKLSKAIKQLTLA